ncbi:MAG: efflux RND transporter periplasmic adaptor subunit [Bryobacteraceae bacterium]
MSRRRRVKLWVRVSILVLILGGSAFALRQFRRTRAVADLPTAAARKGVFSVLVTCRGELTARRSVQLTAPLDVADLQIVWLAPSGGPVTAGMTVIRFDPSRLQQDLKEKSAAFNQAQATLDQAVAQARITADQDKLDLATARYEMEKARLEASKQAIVSAMEGQKSAIDLGMAEEKVKVQQATTELHKSSDAAKIASLARLRDEAKAEVDRTEHRLTLMDMKSPLNGVINYLSNESQGWMNAQPFKVGDHVSAGLAIAEIPDLSTLQMESKVDEVDRGRIALGDSVLVHVDAFPEKVLNAKVQSITPLTEESFNEWPPTRSFKAYAPIEKPDPRLRPAMNASADIVETKIPDAVSIPAKALFTQEGNPIVYVKNNGRYMPVHVRVRARNTDEVAISGLPAGTLVALTEPEQVKQ